MVLSDDFIAELKEKIDISEIISEYVDIKRKGKNLMGICPFHAEKTASFCVYPNNGSFYCFGCGVGGDAITFIRLAEHFDYIEAVKYLAERAGMNLELSDEQDALHKKKMLIYKINRDAAKFFHNSLLQPCGKKALEYLKSRHISPKTIRKFGLGYSPSSGYALTDYLKSLGYKDDDIALANLAFENKFSKNKDRFRDRLMFPIIDVRGNVIAFGARTLKNEVPKYINTSDTPVFKKSCNLFALNFAKNSGKKKLILTEGYMDAISLHQSGFNETVAGLGTALTPEQVKLLSRHADEIILSYDADGPGQKAAERAMDMLRANGVSVKIVSIPQAKDPDEYIRSNGKDGAIRFKNLVETSKNDIEFRLSNLKSSIDISSTEGKIKYLNQATKLISKCDNPIEKEIYASKLCDETGLNKSAIVLQIKKYEKQNHRKKQKKEFKSIEKLTSAINDKVNKEKHKNLRAACAEESVLSCIMNNNDMASSIISMIPKELFITEFNKKVYSAIEKLINENKIIDINSISKNEFSFEEIGKITKISCSYEPHMSTKNSLEEYANILKSENQKNKISNVNQTSENDIKNYIEGLKNAKR